MQAIPPLTEDTVKTLLMAALMCAGAAASAQSIAYRGLPLGSPKAELLKLYPDLVCKPSSPTSHTQGNEVCAADHIYAPSPQAAPLFSYGGRPVADPRFIIIDGRFEAFSADFLPKNYEAIRSALEEAHKAGQERIATLQTLRGASIESRQWFKELPGGTFSLLEHAGTIEYGGIQIASDRYRHYSQSRRTGNPKEGAKDL